LKNAICIVGHHIFPPVRRTRPRAIAHGQAQTGVIAAYCMYASFLRIRPPIVSSFCIGLPEMVFFNGVI